MSEESDIADYLSATKTGIPEDSARIARGTIEAYDSTNKLVSVTVGAGETVIPNVRYFAHYTPVVGDDVHFIRVGPDLMVLGKIARP